MTNKKEMIPEFRNEDEEAEFWDTHSPLDYIPEPKPQKAQVRIPKDSPLTIRLDSEYRNKLESLASNYKMGASTLARAIITNTIDQVVNRKQIAMTFDDAMEALFSNIPVEIKTEAEQIMSSASIANPDDPTAPSYLILNYKAAVEFTKKLWAHLLQTQGVRIVTPKGKERLSPKEQVKI